MATKKKSVPLDPRFNVKSPTDWRIVVLGTSISWGQGLAPGEKFSALLCDHLVTSGAAKRPSIASYARSGARLWDAAAGAGDYPASARRARTAIESLRKQDLLTEAKANRADGECPSGQPFLWTQLLQAEADHADAAVKPKTILIDVGANDVGIMKVVDPTRSAAAVRATVDALSGKIAPFLRAVRTSTLQAQNPRIIVAGYYRAFTASSGGKNIPCGWLLPGALTLIDWRRAELLSGAFDRGFRAVLAAEVAAANEGLSEEGAVRLCFADFEADRGLYSGKNNSLLWELDGRGNPLDSVADARGAHCDDRSTDAASWLICHRASAGHPNPEGTRRFCDAIIGQL